MTGVAYQWWELFHWVDDALSDEEFELGRQLQREADESARLYVPTGDRWA